MDIMASAIQQLALQVHRLPLIMNVLPRPLHIHHPRPISPTDFPPIRLLAKPSRLILELPNGSTESHKPTGIDLVLPTTVWRRQKNYPQSMWSVRSIHRHRRSIPRPQHSIGQSPRVFVQGLQHIQSRVSSDRQNLRHCEYNIFWSKSDN